MLLCSVLYGGSPSPGVAAARRFGTNWPSLRMSETEENTDMTAVTGVHVATINLTSA